MLPTPPGWGPARSGKTGPRPTTGSFRAFLLHQVRLFRVASGGPIAVAYNNPGGELGEGVYPRLITDGKDKEL